MTVNDDSMKEWNYLQAAYKSVKVAHQLAAEALKRYIADESSSVSNRWDVFLEAPEGILPTEQFLPTDLSFWREFSSDIKSRSYRYEVVLWADVDDYVKFTDEQKLEILSRGFEGFTVDW